RELPPLSTQPVLAAAAKPFVTLRGIGLLIQDGSPRLLAIPSLPLPPPPSPASSPPPRPRANSSGLVDGSNIVEIVVTGTPGAGPPATAWKHGVVLTLGSTDQDLSGTDAEALQVRLDLKASAPVTDVRIDGKPVALLTKPGQWSHLIFHAPRD